MLSALRLGLPRCSVRLPGWIWLLLPTLALWPVWLWSGRRMSDGSDDPFGVVALAALLLVFWRERGRLSAMPRLPWLLLALSLCAAAGLAQAWLPALLRAGLAGLADYVVLAVLYRLSAARADG